MKISVEKLLGVKKIISHGNCADGIVAAMICACAYNYIESPLNIEFMSYNTDEHNSLNHEPGMMFVDFTPRYDKWNDFRDVGTIIIDHHETPKKFISGDNVLFADKKESGALLCYNNVLVPLTHGIINNSVLENYSKLANLISIYDTWQEDHIDWDEAQYVTHGVLTLGTSYCLDIAYGREPLNLGIIRTVGKRVLKKALNKAELVGKNSMFRKVGPYTIAYYNNTEKLSSEIGNYLGDKCDFSVGYGISREDNQNKIITSFRSRNGYDTSKITSMLGGGGHRAASGASFFFDQSLPDIKFMIEKIEFLVKHFSMQDIENIINS